MEKQITKDIKANSFQFYYADVPTNWNNDTLNVPNLDKFNSISWVQYFPDEVNNYISPINWTGEFTGTIKIGNYIEHRKYLKLVDGTDFSTYYNIVSVNKVLGVDSILNIEVDIWATYMVKQLAEKTPELLVLRTPDINPLGYQLTDPLVAGIVKSDGFKGYIGSPIDSTGENIVVYTSPSGNALTYYDNSPNNQAGGNYYALFKDLPEGWTRISDPAKKNNILAVPVLGKITPKSDNMEIQAPIHIDNEEIYDFGIYWNGMTDKWNYSERDAAQVKAQQWITDGFSIQWSKTTTKNYQLSLGTFPATLVGSRNQLGTGFSSLRVYSASEWIDDYTVSNLFTPNIDFYYRIKKIVNPLNFNNFIINNYEDDIKNITIGNKEDSAANAVFMGFYHLPSFYYLMGDLNIIKDNISGKNYGCVEINVYGNSIKNMRIGNYNLENSDFIKYFNMKYYDNGGINWGYFWDKDTKNISITGTLFFNESGAIVIASNNILNEGESVIYYGGELPSARKEYIDYINANRSSINNGIRQQKIQFNMSLAKGVIGGIIGGAGAALGAKTAGMGGITSSIIGGVSAAAGTALGIAGTVMNNKAYYAGLKAKHEDIERNTGVVFTTSDTEDMANLITNSLNVLGELTKITIPSEDSLIMMNKMNELYGYLNPKITPVPFKDGIGYYAFDINFLSEWLDNNYLTIRSVKDAILKRVENGVRLFNE